MHKLKILTLSGLSLLIVILLIWWVQPEPPLVEQIPETAQASEPVPDFASIDDVQEKKQAFFDYLRPEIEAQNEYILSVRDFIHAMRAKVISKRALSEQQQSQINWLMKEYRVKNNKNQLSVFDALLRKIDIVPVELVLVQTANESAWGTSRFATEGYNFFGLWCFKKGCGFVPRRRNTGAAHEVAKFDDLSSGMYAYIRNLNRHQAYREMRAIRHQLRNNMQPIVANRLVEGLENYSERGQHYIDELKQMIKTNRPLMRVNQGDNSTDE